MTEKLASDHKKSADFQPHYTIVPGVITRERSFIRNPNQQNIHNRRSLAFNASQGENQSVQMRAKPAMDIYRPPKLKSSNSSTIFSVPAQNGSIAQTKSSPNIHQQMQYFAATNAVFNRRQTGNIPFNGVVGHRPIIVTHSNPLMKNATSTHIPMMNSPNRDSFLNQSTNSNRVKFAAEPQKIYNKSPANNTRNQNYTSQQNQQKKNTSETNRNAFNNNNFIEQGTTDNIFNISPLQRSKSLSSADALTYGMSRLGLGGLSNDITSNIGQFNPEVQSLIDTALENPNNLNSRCLMELTSHFIQRAVESRRYALPIARLCLTIIAKEQQETFLEALLNVCRQWYQEREKLLFIIQGMKCPSRSRFTAFMAFLTEMFCQLKRRQLQMGTEGEGTPPPLILLTLLSKCCEDCVKPPIRSLSEIECLFYVLTCIGQDMEIEMPQQLESFMSLVRDAFLNANDSAPSIRKTLLQLIELKASHWQLPGNTVLYYYPAK